MPSLVQLTVDGGIAVITVDNPPVNALSPGVPEGLLACVEQMKADPALRGAVLHCAGRTFIAGADIREFEKITRGERDPDIGLLAAIEAIESSRKPVVAAIHGTALGGGLETAMACHFRAAHVDAKLGQPEVKLGLIPGAGGTQRLPRLVGVAKAAAMCSLGEPIGAAEARRHGLVSYVEEGDLLSGAVDYARYLVAKRIAPRRTRDETRKLGNEPVNRSILNQALAAVRAKWPERAAPVQALGAIWAATTMSFEDGMREENRRFLECLYSDESKKLVREFFDQRAAKKSAPPSEG